MFKYILQRFGKGHVAQIITYGQSKLKNGIDDLCRTLKQTDPNTNEVIAYGQELADKIKKSIPHKFPNQKDPDYGTMIKLADNPESFREAFREQTDKMHKLAVEFKQWMQQYPEIDKALKFNEGLIRSFGKHAAAVVITDDPITDYIPVYKLKKDDILPVTAFNMKEIDEDLQMLKLDALSLKTLTTIRIGVENINLSLPPDKQFDVRDLQIRDADTFKTVRDGYTVGVFQVSGGPITGYTKRVRPTHFDNITDILGLYRPGPLEALIDAEKYPGVTMADKYVENADDIKLQQYMQTIPENLRPIYADTRGIIIYQEQIMQLAQDMAGYTLGGADLMRRGIGKKDDALIASLKYEFVYGTEKGIPMLEAEIAKLDAITDDTRDQKSIDTYKKQLKGMKKLMSDGKPVEGCIDRGYDEHYSVATFDAIRRFSGYSFNRSHLNRVA